MEREGLNGSIDPSRTSQHSDHCFQPKDAIASHLPDIPVIPDFGDLSKAAPQTIHLSPSASCKHSHYTDVDHRPQPAVVRGQSKHRCRCNDEVIVQLGNCHRSLLLLDYYNSLFRRRLTQKK